MNRYLKPLLILMGLGMIAYATYIKTLAIHSPRSAWENSLVNDARQGDEKFYHTFNRIMDGVEADWNVVVLAGIAVAVSAFFIRIGPENADRKRRHGE